MNSFVPIFCTPALLSLPVLPGGTVNGCLLEGDGAGLFGGGCIEWELPCLLCRTGAGLFGGGGLLFKLALPGKLGGGLLGRVGVVIPDLLGNTGRGLLGELPPTNNVGTGFSGGDGDADDNDGLPFDAPLPGNFGAGLFGGGGRFFLDDGTLSISCPAKFESDFEVFIPREGSCSPVAFSLLAASPIAFSSCELLSGRLEVESCEGRLGKTIGWFLRDEVGELGAELCLMGS